MRRPILFLTALALLASSCGTSAVMVNKKDIDVEWIAGIWKHKDKELYEKWVKLSDTEYKGLAYDLNAGYANITESMRIFRQGKHDWYFEAVVKENNNVPIQYKWIPDPVITLKFVNEKHDFPQIVQYKKEAFDVMSASISNLSGDQKKTFDFTRLLNQ
ncbi:MAG TPA: hypothetical protein VFX48_00835 [Saprospiraceae bacterium]|nr:hypothetical protein [Saprospiraceae bacterium]